MTMPRGEILEDFLSGGPLQCVDVVDCHAHLGPALYMQVPDAGPDGLVRELDALGVKTACISHSVAMVSDWKLGNDLAIEAVRRYPERIFGYAFYNPRYPSCMEAEMDRCAQAGLRGLKVHPDFHQVRADSPLYDKLYERAVSENRVLLCHYAGGPAPLAGAPLYRTVVQRFPKATYIMAHSLPTFAAVDLAVDYFGANPNVFFCLANAFQTGVIEYAVQKLGADRLLYGSDGCWGAMEPRLGMVCTTELAEADKRKILGANFRALMARCA